MKVTNTTNKLFKFQAKGTILMLYPWQSADVPDHFRADPTFRLALDSGDVKEVKPEPEKAAEEPQEVPAEIPEEISEEAQPEINEEEEAPKTRKRKK